MPSHVSEWRAVVVCEPDVAALESLCDRLRADGFHVLPASAATDALRLCRRDKPDLMLLDMALPEASSVIVLRRIREAHAAADRLDPRLPIIALGERVDDGDRALEEGADDFLSKPVSYEELRACITAVVRRTEGPDRPPIRVGDLVIDLAGRVVHAGGREVHVTRKEFMLLEILAIEPTRMFTKNALVWMIWMVDYSQAAGRTLDSHASRLRRKLDLEEQKYVINCWGIGYRLTNG